MKRVLVSLALIGLSILAAAPLAAQTSLDAVASQVRSQVTGLPGTVPIVVLNPADKDFPRQSYAIHRSTAADGTTTVEWKSSRVESVQSFRADGTLVHARQTDLVKNLILEETVSADRSSVRTVITDRGQVKSDKKAALKPGVALRDELQNLVPQAWKAGIRDGLKFQSLSPDGGMPGDFLILFKTVGDPTSLSDKYAYPAEFKAALAGRTSYLVADMALQGIGAFFYPHHFYQVFVVTPAGLQFVAYFGEDPKNPTFQFVTP